MKYLFITLIVQDGENRHTHRVLHTTYSNIKFAAQLYAHNYYGRGERNGDWWEFNAGSIAVKVENVRELSEYEFKLLSDIFSGNVRKGYFEIVQAGHCQASQREEIQVHCGENGNLFLYQDADKLGFIVDVYGQNDIAESMTVWEEDLNPEEESEEPFDPNNVSSLEIDVFVNAWGQKHGELCANLGYNNKSSDDIIMLDYFWYSKTKKWIPKLSSLYSEREQAMADYLRSKQ